jgi:hypothetical protein
MSIQSHRAKFPAYLKPWSLCHIDGTKANVSSALPEPLGTIPKAIFIGEVVSYPTPDSTIMVRAIPGMPGTMVEVPCDAVIQSAPSYAVIHYAKVAPNLAIGVRLFPVDMLRYDHAVPVNFMLTEEPERAELDAWGCEWPTGSPLIVAAASNAKRNSPFHPGQWQSFGWECVPYYVEDLRKVQR